MIIPIKDAQVGDQILGYKANAGWIIFDNVCVVSSICDSKLQVSVNGGRPYVLAYIHEKFELKIERPSEELTILASEARVGDMITDFSYVGSNFKTWRSAQYPANPIKWKIVEISDYIYYGDSTFKLTLGSPSDTYKLKVRRAGTTAVAGPSPWNGKCPRCSKGIYIGFLSIEHEGGKCMK